MKIALAPTKDNKISTQDGQFEEVASQNSHTNTPGTQGYNRTF